MSSWMLPIQRRHNCYRLKRSNMEKCTEANVGKGDWTCIIACDWVEIDWAQTLARSCKSILPIFFMAPFQKYCRSFKYWVQIPRIKVNILKLYKMYLEILSLIQNLYCISFNTLFCMTEELNLQLKIAVLQFTSIFWLIFQFYSKTTVQCYLNKTGFMVGSFTN